MVEYTKSTTYSKIIIGTGIHIHTHISVISVELEYWGMLKLHAIPGTYACKNIDMYVYMYIHRYVCICVTDMSLFLRLEREINW